ncbi:MAG: hypothetical protein J0H12_01860 [Candidatus Paracaedimonas acanthamoebae]|uniref:Uncharacterized protein n=1 Tax=Candidatus Paracaedimonas acanthamoebae TaxID=244581 RepID=A0A8J7PLI8_9PROT|nr:hypothetical protein [Candidatus Paracaedimonas acanthamoebae]
MTTLKHLLASVLYLSISLCHASDDINELGKDLENLEVFDSKPKFVVNVIAYVPTPSVLPDQDSSDEEDDHTFEPESFDFDENDLTTYPFRTIKPGKKELYDEKELGIVERVDCEEPNILLDKEKSRVVFPFLHKLKTQAFDRHDNLQFSSSLRTVIGLNRPRSLSTRLNNVLFQEMAASKNLSDPILEPYYSRFAFFWNYRWFDKKDNCVPYQQVRKFYKQLKRKSPKKAKVFRKMTEQKTLVPYQGLREYVKNHASTKHFITEFRGKSPSSRIYLSLLDSDTLNFNSIFSSYLRIIKQNPQAITAMTTGYIFQGNGYDEDYPFHIASEIDRKIRVSVARHLPLGVYYPEPNLCILVPTGHKTLPESFIDPKLNGACESVALLRSVKKRTGTLFVFADDNPLVTTVPERARLTKSHKTEIEFSDEFKKGASPTERDIERLKHVSQSHFNSYVLLTNLYINRAFKMTDKNFGHFKGILNKFYKTPTHENFIELRQYVSQETLNSLSRAFEDVKQIINEFIEENQRTLNEETIIQILEDKGIDLSTIEKEKMQIFADESVTKLISDDVLDLDELIEAPIQALRDILYDQEIFELMEEYNVPFSEALSLYNDCEENLDGFQTTIDLRDVLLLNNFCEENGEDFLELAEKAQEFLGLGETIENFIKLYQDDPLHIECMIGDPTDIGLDQAPDIDPVVMEYLDEDDIAWIREQLGETDQVLFDTNLGLNDEYDEEDDDRYGEEYDYGNDEDYPENSDPETDGENDF